VFSITQTILLFFVPESPKYLLLKKNDSVRAGKGLFYLGIISYHIEILLALQWLRKTSDLQNEISEIQEEQDRQVESVCLYTFFYH